MFKKLYYKLVKKYKIVKTVKKINKILDVKLYKWQIDYIFNDGPFVYDGRGNGKTLACQLKCIFDNNYKIVKDSSVRETYILPLNAPIPYYNKDAFYDVDWLTMRDDSLSVRRRRMFQDGLFEIYDKLSAHGMKLKPVCTVYTGGKWCEN